jgi:hypothetical protein
MKCIATTRLLLSTITAGHAHMGSPCDRRRRPALSWRVTRGGWRGIGEIVVKALSTRQAR